MINNGTGSTGSFIRYNPERTDIAVSEDELNQIISAGQNQWKDFSLIFFALGIPCILNAIERSKSPFELTLSLFLNYLIGGLGIALGTTFAFMWGKLSKKNNALIERIKSRPKMKIELHTSSSGSMDTISIESKSTG